MKNGLVMLATVLVFTLFGSYIASSLSNMDMGNFSKFMTLFVGLKFLARPVMVTAEAREQESEKQKIQQSIL